MADQEIVAYEARHESYEKRYCEHLRLVERSRADEVSGNLLTVGALTCSPSQRPVRLVYAGSAT